MSRKSKSRSSDGRKSTGGDNVQVVIRCRPQNKRERKKNEDIIVTTNSKASEVIVQHNQRNNRDDGKRRFTFDHVFGEESTQQEVYNKIVKPVVAEVLEGFNCTVFAYGQTGTGKTHTMEGDVASQEMKGIIPRSVEDIFHRLKSITSDSSVKISFMELYNEQLEDLLTEQSEDAPRLQLAQTQRGVIVQNLESKLVKTANEIYTYLEAALAKRRVSATEMNKQSSRSHSVFTITIHMKETTPEGEDLLKVGKLNLVDLAGSECVGRSGASGDRKREAGNINQSLLTLGRVISALVEKRGHIPYRDSKLTRILKESLGGSAKTTIIATITPSQSGFEETCSTLKYANTAKSIENKPEVNQRMTKQALLKDYCLEMDRLRQDLVAQRNKDGVFMTKERYDEMMTKEETNEILVKEAETALNKKTKELDDMMLVLGVTQEELDATKKELGLTKDELSDTYIVSIFFFYFCLPFGNSYPYTNIIILFLGIGRS
jgi:kinesin family protein 11